MIGSLSGVVGGIFGDEVVIDVHGVGYLVTPSAAALAKVNAPGSKISLHIFTDVKENDISLFGFSGRLEREVFILLKKVKGIGSKVALGIVSSMGAEQLLVCIGSEDIAALQRVPGVGKKTAERLILELRERVGELTPSASGSKLQVVKSKVSVAAGKGLSSPAQDAMLALEKLGVPVDQAQKAVEIASTLLGAEADSGEILKNALVNL
jgi:Holliday junction DNA helicase RuvA